MIFFQEKEDLHFVLRNFAFLLRLLNLELTKAL